MTAIISGPRGSPQVTPGCFAWSRGGASGEGCPNEREVPKWGDEQIRSYCAVREINPYVFPTVAEVGKVDGDAAIREVIVSERPEYGFGVHTVQLIRDRHSVRREVEPTPGFVSGYHLRGPGRESRYVCGIQGVWVRHPTSVVGEGDGHRQKRADQEPT